MGSSIIACDHQAFFRVGQQRPQNEDQTVHELGLDDTLKILQSLGNLPDIANCKNNCEAHIVEAITVCEDVSKLTMTWREDGWRLQGLLLRLNKESCQQLARKLILHFKESYHPHTQAPAAKEFLTAVKRAKNLVDKCAHDKWLLKAVELWECSEHFVEVLLDLCWSSHIMSLELQNGKLVKCWLEKQEELLNSWRLNAVSTFYEETSKIDKDILGSMVEAKLMDTTRNVHASEHQLALLLAGRLKGQNSWYPPVFKTFGFYIRSNFVTNGSRKEEGAHGIVLRFPWVYEEHFAVKMRHPDQFGSDETFKGEFDLLDKFRSPYIVGVVGYWEIETKLRFFWGTVTLCPFLLMEDMELNLQELIYKIRNEQEGNKTGFSALQSINLMLPVAKAMRYLHEKDVVHRDLKPQNIMCKISHMNQLGDLEAAIVKLVDFGEARKDVFRIPANEWRPAGTKGYTDPEMWKTGVVDFDPLRADVFSFGMVFGELLTWKSPEKALGVADLRKAQAELNAKKRPQLPEDVPNYVTGIVESCWCADPLMRPEFIDICSMLQNAKLILSGMKFDGETDELFTYEDATGVQRCILDRGLFQA